MPAVEGEQARVEIGKAEVTPGAKESQTVEVFGLAWGEDGTRTLAKVQGPLQECLDPAPTPLGQSVTCTAHIIHVEGTQVTFQVEARDAHEIISRGIHKRAVIRIESFARRVARKVVSG